MSKVVYSHGMTKLQMVELLNRTDMNNMGTKKSVPCYIVDDYAIIKSNIACSHYAEQESVIEIGHKLADNGVNVVRTYGYISDESTRRDGRTASYCDCYFIMDRAPGQELYRNVTYSYGKTSAEDINSLFEYLEMMNNIPQEHYDKYVADYLAIRGNGIAVDPSKKGNFFYDPEKGFTFIDVRNSRGPEDERFVVQNILYPVAPGTLCLDDMDNPELVRRYDILAAGILVKMEHALLVNGFDRQSIDDSIAPKKFEDGVYTSGVRFGSITCLDEAEHIV